MFFWQQKIGVEGQGKGIRLCFLGCHRAVPGFVNGLFSFQQPRSGQVPGVAHRLGCLKEHAKAKARRQQKRHPYPDPRLRGVVVGHQFDELPCRSTCRDASGQEVKSGHQTTVQGICEADERAIGIRDEPGNTHAPHVGQAKNESADKNGAVPVTDRLGRRNAAGHVTQRIKGLGFAHVGACALGSALATLADQDWRRGPSGGGRPGRACEARQGGAVPTRGR